MRTPRALSAGLLLLSAVAAWAEETAATKALLFHGELLDSLPQLSENNRAVYEAELARGVQGGTWTESEKETALQKVQHVLPPTGYPLSNRIPTPFRGPDGMVFGDLARWDPWSPLGSLEEWVQRRLTATERFRDEVTKDYAYAAMARAEELWLAAREARDLEEAILVLGKARKPFSGLLDSAARRPDLSNMGQFRVPLSSRFTGNAVEDLIEHLNVIACDDPLLLPDPDLDPKGFAMVRVIWNSLQSRGHRFLARPAVALRFRQDEARFLVGAVKAERALDAAILHEASAAEFEKLLQRLAFYDTPQDFPMRPAGNIQRFTDRLDYHLLLGRNPRPALFPPVPVRVPQNREHYHSWLRWRQAQESGAEAAMETARQEVQRRLISFPFAVARRVEDELTRKRPVALAIPPPIEPAAGGSAVEALVVSLAGIPQSADRNTSGATALAAIWNQLRQAGTIRPLEDPEQFARVWSRLAADPSQRHLFARRDRAAREVLAAIGGNVPDNPAVPVVTTLRDHLEAAIAARELDRAGRILALSAAGGFLAREEHERYRSELELIRRAAQFAAEGEARSARKAFKTLLATTVSPAVAAMAVRGFKEAEPRAARPIAP